MLLDLDPEQPAGEGRGVDGHAREVRQDVRQPADVVLVGVGDQERPDVGLALAEVGDVGDDEVDAEHLLVGEHQAAVDDDDVVAVLDDVHVLADLPHPAERDDPERRVAGIGRRRFSLRHRSLRSEQGRRVVAARRGARGWLGGCRRTPRGRRRGDVGRLPRAAARRSRASVQHPRQAGDVVVALALHLGAPERGRGMEERVRERVAGAGRLRCRRVRAVDLGDPLARPEVAPSRTARASRRPPDRAPRAGAGGTARRPRSRRARGRGCPAAGTSRCS